MLTNILALAGGVGGAKLALGLMRIVPPNDLTVVVNTGDDEEFHGLHVSPDLDTVMYTLANLYNKETGWGLTDETFKALGMLERYGAPTWFNLGDKDMATHIERTRLLREGATLSQVTRRLCERLGVQANIVPMSDQPVRTMVETAEGDLTFQEYFVRRRCEPVIKGLRFHGADRAEMSPGFQEALGKAQAIVFCPSNPMLSIGPILAVSVAREALESFTGPRIAVSPIIGDQALKGPAAKMLRELGEEASCVGVARRLDRVCDVLVIDSQDAHRSRDVESVGLQAIATNTIMETDADKEQLAREVLRIAERLRQAPQG